MKNRISIIAITVIISFILAVLTGFTHNIEDKEIEDLLIKRTDIMQNVLLNKISVSEGCRKLQQIETGKLYSEDSQVFEEYKNSDFDPVLDMRLISLIEESYVSDIKTYLATIEWTTLTCEGINVYELTHYISVKCLGETVKLLSFEPAKSINLPQ